MGNRILKESIKTSDEIDQLTWFEYACFTRLILTVDDYGRYPAKPMLLRNILFPIRGDISTDAIEVALKHFVELDLIQVYTVDGKEYLQLTTWAKHQTIRNKKSKYPGPEESDARTAVTNCIQLKSIEGKCSRNPIRIQSESKSEIESSSEYESVSCEVDAEEDDEQDNAGDDETEKKLTGNDRNRQEVLDAWQNAGFPTNTVTLNKVIDLFGKNGKDAMLDAIDKTVEANARSPLRYMIAVLEPSYRPMRFRNSVPAANFTQREYLDDTDDMDRLMAES